MRQIRWMIFCCLLCLVPLVFGCIWSWPTIKVSGHSLDVFVSYRAKPARNVEVRIVSPEEKEVFSFAVTDGDGKATLQLPSTGNWLLRTNSGFFDADARKLVISKSDDPGTVTSVALKWPSSLATEQDFILKTRRIAGQLQLHTATSTERLASTKLELHYARTGVLIGSTTTDTNGWFDFQNTREGLYALIILDVPPPSLTDEQRERFTAKGLQGYLSRRYSGSFPIEVVSSTAAQQDATVVVSLGDCGVTWQSAKPF